MGDIETDLARATEAAWQGFQQDLGERISELDDGACLLILVDEDHEDHEDDDDGCAPYVQVQWLEDGLAMAEVSSNRYLHPKHRLGKARRRQLQMMGWSKAANRASLNYSEQFDLFQSEDMAAMLVAVLRDIFGVIHPAFLGGDIGTRDAVGEPETEASVDPEEPLAVVPHDREHLDQLVEQALTPVFGHAPKRDCDGDIGVRAGTAGVFVRVVPDHLLIRLFAELAVEVTDHEAAKFEVGVLNRDRPFVKFELVHDHVLATVHLPATPFAPEHLRQTLAMMCELADEVDGDLAVRVKGRRFYEPTDPSIERLLSDED